MFVEGFFLYNFACVCCGGRQVSARISHACFSRRLLVAQNFYEVFSQPYLCANLRRSLSALVLFANVSRSHLSRSPLSAQIYAGRCLRWFYLRMSHARIFRAAPSLRKFTQVAVCAGFICECLTLAYFAQPPLCANLRRLLSAQFRLREFLSQPPLCANLRRSLSAQFRLREFLSQPPLCANLRRLLSAQFRLREFLSHPPLCANLRRSLSALLFCTIFLCSRSSSPTALSLRKFTQPRPQPKITQTAPCAAPPQSTPPACTRRPPPTTSKSCAPPRHTRAAPAPACPLSSAASGT